MGPSPDLREEEILGASASCSDLQRHDSLTASYQTVASDSEPVEPISRQEVNDTRNVLFNRRFKYQQLIAMNISTITDNKSRDQVASTGNSGKIEVKEMLKMSEENTSNASVNNGTGASRKTTSPKSSSDKAKGHTSKYMAYQMRAIESAENVLERKKHEKTIDMNIRNVHISNERTPFVQGSTKHASGFLRHSSYSDRSVCTPLSEDSETAEFREELIKKNNAKRHLDERYEAIMRNRGKHIPVFKGTRAGKLDGIFGECKGDGTSIDAKEKTDGMNKSEENPIDNKGGNASGPLSDDNADDTKESDSIQENKEETTRSLEDSKIPLHEIEHGAPDDRASVRDLAGSGCWLREGNTPDFGAVPDETAWLLLGGSGSDIRAKCSLQNSSPVQDVMLLQTNGVIREKYFAYESTAAKGRSPGLLLEDNATISDRICEDRPISVQENSDCSREKNDAERFNHHALDNPMSNNILSPRQPTASEEESSYKDLLDRRNKTFNDAVKRFGPLNAKNAKDIRDALRKGSTIESLPPINKSFRGVVQEDDSRSPKCVSNQSGSEDRFVNVREPMNTSRSNLDNDQNHNKHSNVQLPPLCDPRKEAGAVNASKKCAKSLKRKKSVINLQSARSNENQEVVRIKSNNDNQSSDRHIECVPKHSSRRTTVEPRNPMEEIVYDFEQQMETFLAHNKEEKNLYRQNKILQEYVIELEKTTARSVDMMKDSWQAMEAVLTQLLNAKNEIANLRNNANECANVDLNVGLNVMSLPVLQNRIILGGTPTNFKESPAGLHARRLYPCGSEIQPRSGIPVKNHGRSVKVAPVSNELDEEKVTGILRAIPVRKISKATGAERKVQVVEDIEVIESEIAEKPVEGTEKKLIKYKRYDSTKPATIRGMGTLHIKGPKKPVGNLQKLKEKKTSMHFAAETKVVSGVNPVERKTPVVNANAFPMGGAIDSDYLVGKPPICRPPRRSRPAVVRGTEAQTNVDHGMKDVGQIEKNTICEGEDIENTQGTVEIKKQVYYKPYDGRKPATIRGKKTLHIQAAKKPTGNLKQYVNKRKEAKTRGDGEMGVKKECMFIPANDDVEETSDDVAGHVELPRHIPRPPAILKSRNTRRWRGSTDLPRDQ